MVVRVVRVVEADYAQKKCQYKHDYTSAEPGTHSMMDLIQKRSVSQDCASYKL